MLEYPIGPTLDPSQRVLSLIVDEIADPPVAVHGNGLPAATFEINAANIILTSTPCAGPMFCDVMSRYSAATNRDVVVVRTGLFPEMLDPVTIDIALFTLSFPFVATDYIFYRGLGGDLWLIPPTVCAYMKVGPTGLDLHSSPPFEDLDDRSDGACRAAAEIVRLVSRRTGR